MNYQTSIGLEVHVQLLTRSKLFCGCSTQFGSSPNSQTCPVCLGLPGVLPSINKKAVEYTILTALALSCKVSPFSRFARKNYYYPDLPKNFQISQYDEPVAKDGYLEFELDGKSRRMRIQRVHVEEDAGKIIHGEDIQNPEDQDSSFIDYNRTGIPLMEIVSYPEIHSPEEAYQYLVNLKRVLGYLEVSDCNMEEGSLRCDANISLAPEGERLGVKTELKNLNSFKEIREGLASEIERQAALLDKGEKVVQETRLWDPHEQATIPMRSKEEAHDYRYFPEPDLLPVKVSQEWIRSVKEAVVELPSHRYQRFISEYHLPLYDAGVLTESRELADYFEECVRNFPHPKVVSNWIMGEFLRLVKKETGSLQKIKVKPLMLAHLLEEVEKGVISGKLAKEVFQKMFQSGKSAEEIIRQEKLGQISNEGELEEIIQRVMMQNSKAVNDFRKGKDKALIFLVGQVMRETKGRANPDLVNRLLKEKMGVRE
jgi:aspartyl-tRNA(Asn)/glutamyl-tRNA(Gln) amidotransferase subunit B